MTFFGKPLKAKMHVMLVSDWHEEDTGIRLGVVEEQRAKLLCWPRAYHRASNCCMALSISSSWQEGRGSGPTACGCMRLALSLLPSQRPARAQQFSACLSYLINHRPQGPEQGRESEVA